MPAKTYVVKVAFLVLCLSILALQHGCSNSGGGGGSTPAPASSGNALTLSLSTTSGVTSVVADGRSTIPIRLQVTNASGTVSGVSVTFATTAGSLSASPVVRASRDVLSADPPAIPRADSDGSVSVTTDANGIAQVLLTASTIAETAVVTADALGFRANIVINFVAGPAARVQFSASSSTVTAGGTLTFTATVTDANGNSVSGETVTFTLSTNTSGATLSATSAVTTGNGQAAVTYTAGFTPGADTVQARATSSGVSGSTSVTVVAGSTSQVQAITVVPGAMTLVADGNSTVAIRATVSVASGSPAGIEVSFKTTAGSLSSDKATTDTNGVASVNLIAGTNLGDVTVTASAGGFNATTIVTLVAGAPTVVQLSANPPTVNAGGGSTIVATVTDAGGNPVGSQSLTFTAPTRGTLSALSGITDTNGQLIVTYTAGATPTTETVQTRTTNGITGKVDITTTNAPAGGVATITVGPGGSSSEIVADGVSTVAIQAKVTVTSGALAGIPVAFTTTAGRVAPATATTDANGFATVILTSPTSLGTATVTASAGGFNATTTVTFVAGAPAVVQLSASPVTVNAKETSIITATVTDATGNPVNGQSLTFTAPTQGTLSALSGITNTNGQLTVTYTAGAAPTTETVQAKATNGITGTVEITTVSAPGGSVSAVTLSASLSSVVADGTSTVAITARVSVISGVLSGIPVTFTTTAGSLSPTTKNTDATGAVTVTLTSASSPGMATVTASAGGFNATTTVTFVVGPPAVVQLSANPTTVNTKETSTLIAMVTDAKGNPVSAQRLNLSFTANTSGATLSPLTGLTDASGQLTVTYTAGTTPGNDTVQAQANGVVGTVTVTVTTPPPSSITAIAVTAGAPTMVADGTSSVAIRATVTGATGGLPNIPVTFTTTAGSLSAATAQTDANGVATVNLVAARSLGTATVTATAGGFSNNVMVKFIAGAPAVVSLSATLTTVSVRGIATIQVSVTDANGNPTELQTLTLSLATNASGATLSPLTGMTDTSGQFGPITYTAGPNPGTDTVQARTVNGITGTLSITVTPIAGAARVDLLVSSPQLASNGVGSVTLTALLRDAANNVLSGVPVSFQADSGSVQVINGTTEETGTATALLTTGGDPRNRTITVTATSGNISDQNTVQVTGTTLFVSGANTLVLGVTTRLTVLLRDSGGTGIPNQPITVSSALGNPLSATTITTDATGQATVDVTANIPGNDTIQVAALGATATASLLISADNFVLTAPAPAAEVPLNTPRTVTLHWDQASVDQVGKTINFFATRGNFAATPTCPAVATPTISATTDANGNATVNICSDNAGPAVISAAANMSSGPSSQVEIEFVATTVASVIVQASPTTLGVNAPGDNTQQSIITAVLRDAQGNLVKNQTVSFSVNDVSGGKISPAAAVTDSFGRAGTVYTAGAAPSAKDGVIITAAASGITDTVTLTVAQQPLFVILGTGNVVGTPTSTQYALPYSVLVTDANGNPKANATVLLAVLPTRYEKGFYSPFVDSNNVCIGWGKVSTSQVCQNEDSNFNGILDTGEDFNSNSKLDPGNVATVLGSVTTNAGGFALFDVVYAREFTWVEVALTARTVVAGSEGSSQATFFLPGVASDFNNCLIAPPGQRSPDGIATTCSCDEKTDPTCPIFTGSPVTLTTAQTTLPSAGGTFIFSVTGGTKTSYNLTATTGTLSTLNVIFGQTFTLTVPPNPSTTTDLTIIVAARDAVTGQAGTVTLTQLH